MTHVTPVPLLQDWCQLLEMKLITVKAEAMKTSLLFSGEFSRDEFSLSATISCVVEILSIGGKD